MERAASGSSEVGGITAPARGVHVARAIHVSTLVFAAGQSAVLPLLALRALEIGATPAVAGLAVAARSGASMVATVPIGRWIERRGERAGVLLATASSLLGSAGLVLAPDVVTFLLSVSLVGCGWAIFLLVRLVAVTDATAVASRGRALSTLGGVHRAGSFVGPVVGAGVVTVADMSTVFALHAVAVGASAVLLVRNFDAGRSARSMSAAPFASVVRTGWPALRGAGVVALSIAVLRSARVVALPLWAEHVGVSTSGVSLAFGLAGAADMVLFWPVGRAMDRRGRRRVAMACLATLGASLVVLPLSGSYATILTVAVLMGIGNGLGSGIGMTLGADCAPAEGRSSFLALWRVVGEIGTTAGPLVVALAAVPFGIAGAPVLTGVLGVAGGAIGLRRMAEPLVRART